MNTPAIRLESRQHQTLTPRLQHAVRLLQLSSMDFAQEVQNAMGRNPFLEGDEPAAEASADHDAAEPDTAASTPPSAEPAPNGEPDPSWERDSWSQLPSGSRNNNAGDGETSLMERVAADTTLRQHLHSQRNVMPLTDRDHLLMGVVIESLDDDGYLRTPLEELLALVQQLDPPAELSEMRTALKLVQSLDPCGVAARDVVECLLLQLCNLEDQRECQLAHSIISEHMPRLAQRDVSGLAKTLGCSMAEVESVVKRIRRMDPRPGWRFGSGHVHYVAPDVVVKKFNGNWTAVLNPAVVPRVRVNQMYADLFQRHRGDKHAELAAHLQEARWTVRNVEQRFSTILSVSLAILKRQHHFLEFGPLAMKPMCLREIAEEVGIHESTVSRVTNNKYMSTPAGVFELKYFFSRAMPTAAGGACSPTAIRGVIQDMINAETPTTPLSDADITRALARQGLQVARRTVTKYRQMLKIAAVDQRRLHSQAA